jgi:serine/threonine-protein kinase
VSVAKEIQLEAGYPVGEYEIEAKIGEGGFGSVFRAVHPVIGKVVAIKVLHRRYSAQPEMVRRFVAEARAVNQIRHRNIIDIFAFGQLDDGRHYYVMEYLEGMTLEQYITERGPMGLGEAIPILRQLARALDAAHSKGIAHRDLKPDNVFMAMDEDGAGQPKLLDFGIAKLLSEEAPQKYKTRTGAPIGTPQYMSPEQCRGRNVDHRTDIYGFGIMAYRMLTGMLPFDGEDYMEILMAHLQQEPRPPSAIVTNLPVGVDEAVLWMLQKDPAERPPNLLTAVRSLEAAAEAAGIVLPRAPSLARMPIVSTSPVAVQGTPPVVTSLVERSGDEDDPFLPSLAAGMARPQPLASDSRTHQVAPEDILSQEPALAAAQSEYRRSMELARRSADQQVAPAGNTMFHAGATRRSGALKLAILAGSVAVAVAVGILVNRFLAPPDPEAVVAAEHATSPATAGEGDPGAGATPAGNDAPEVPGEPDRALAAAGSDAGASGEPAQRFVTMIIEGPPANTEVYGPQGLLGLVPGKIQLVRGEEPVMLTFKAENHRPETREVVPDEDRFVQVELDAKPRARPAPRRGGRKDKKRKERDTIEDPFE